MAVWGDDPTTEAIDGALEGEPLHFRLWDGSTEQIIIPKTIDRQECLSHWQNGSSDRQECLSWQVELSTARTASLPRRSIFHPSSFALYPAFPNPFNSYVTLKYELPAQTRITLRVFDLSGREVAMLTDGIVTAGQHQAAWDASCAASGVYVCRMEAGGVSASVKLVLTR